MTIANSRQRLAVLMTCHNRVANTLKCLECLFAAAFPENMQIDVFLVDDGSTDGTSAAIELRFPQVTVIVGTGDLYWAGGMRLSWSIAAHLGYDAYLWLNDDTYLNADALLLLHSAAVRMTEKAIICGCLCDSNHSALTYGGKRLGIDSLLQPNGSLQECDVINGNCVYVPQYVYKILGSIDNVFTHAIGDYDYGLRAKAHGINVVITPVVIGVCDYSQKLPKWCLSTTPLLQRLRTLYSPLAYAQPVPYFVYVKRHFGLLSAVKQWIAMHIRVFLPWFWKRKI